MEIIKNFVVFEGLDGSGTTTQLKILEANLGSQKRQSQTAAEPLPSLYITFEPTDGIIGRIIRKSLKKEITLSAESIAYLFAADRNEHLNEKGGILERCRRGELVVSDRYFASSLVYQGISCGGELARRLNQDFPGPELLLYFDIDPGTAEKRLSRRSQREIYEYLDFQIKARELYKSTLEELSLKGVKVESIDAALPPEEIGQIVLGIIKKMPIFT